MQEWILSLPIVIIARRIEIIISLIARCMSPVDSTVITRNRGLFSP